MTNKIYNKTNFHKHTFCVFEEVNLEAIRELRLDYQSKSGSSYYFTNEGVYRFSNHWGRAANCKWRLSSVKKNNSRNRLGFAKWTDFYPDNDFEKLYFIVYENETVHYYHKQSVSYTSDKVLRTASDTTKLIKQIRVLLEDNAWAKHLREINIEILRIEIIEKLINSNQSFQEIRKDYF